jgi:hypothetical protein
VSRYARKRDETHAQIRDGLRGFGIWVADTADCPGFVDLVACTPQHNAALVLATFRRTFRQESAVTDALDQAVKALRAQFALLEVKREKGPKGGGGGSLTEAQEKLIRSCPGEIHVVRTLDEALEAIGARRR